MNHAVTNHLNQLLDRMDREWVEEMHATYGEEEYTRMMSEMETAARSRRGNSIYGEASVEQWMAALADPEAEFIGSTQHLPPEQQEMIRAEMARRGISVRRITRREIVARRAARKAA